MVDKRRELEGERTKERKIECYRENERGMRQRENEMREKERATNTKKRRERKRVLETEPKYYLQNHIFHLTNILYS